MEETPTVHEGPTVRAMEAKGIRTNVGDLNRRIRATNAAIQRLRKKIAELLSWLGEVKEELSADIHVGKLLDTVEWDYPEFHLTMHCFMCTLSHDAMHLNEHEAAKWLNMTTLHSVKWLPADEALLPVIEKELNEEK